MPAVATEFPLPAREWSGLRGLFYGESAGFLVVITYGNLDEGRGRFPQLTSIREAGVSFWSILLKAGIFFFGGEMTRGPSGISGACICLRGVKAYRLEAKNPVITFCSRSHLRGGFFYKRLRHPGKIRV